MVDVDVDVDVDSVVELSSLALTELLASGSVAVAVLESLTARLLPSVASCFGAFLLAALFLLVVVVVVVGVVVGVAERAALLRPSPADELQYDPSRPESIARVSSSSLRGTSRGADAPPPSKQATKQQQSRRSEQKRNEKVSTYPGK